MKVIVCNAIIASIWDIFTSYSKKYNNNNKDTKNGKHKVSPILVAFFLKLNKTSFLKN